MKSCRLFFALLFLAIALVRNVSAQAQTDFDGDGISDITYVNPSGTQLLWQAKGSQSSTSVLNQNFGLTTDGIAIAHWLPTDAPALGIVRLDTDQKHIVWKVLDNGIIDQGTLGNAGDLVVSGGDYDGNGLADAAVVRVTGKDLKWYVIKNMFSGSPSKVRSYNVGVVGDKALFMNYDGTADWLGAFGLAGKSKARLYLKNIRTGKSKTIRGFPAALAKGQRPRPFPIGQDDGTDLLGFITTDATDTTVTVYSAKPSKILQLTFPGLGTTFVGDFLPDEPGEEIAFHSGTSITYLNPVTQVRSIVDAVSGTPIDEVNFTAVSGPAPVATPTATPTSTPTVG